MKSQIQLPQVTSRGQSGDITFYRLLSSEKNVSKSQDSRMAKIISMDALERLVLCCLLTEKKIVTS